jgi:histidinol-phosphate aminotransferase
LNVSSRIPTPRATVSAMAGYTPGEQPGPGVRVIKLNTNENPYPPSPRVMDVLRGFDPDQLRRYPNPTAEPFRQAAARKFGLRVEQVIAGNGSDDILNLVMRAYLDPGDLVAYPDPTYSLYPVLAQLQDARVACVPWDTGWALPIDALIATRPRIVLVANPNAPSGTLVPTAELGVLAQRFAGLVLIDEAYINFADEDALPLLAGHPNVLISRTFSKSHGLAGLRFGYALGDAAVIAELMKVKDSYNCDALSIDAAVAALQDEAYARTTWDAVRNERRRLSAALTGLGFDVIPSHANFVFVRPPGGDARGLYLSLKARGILVRHFALPGLDDRLRITVGAPADNDALLAALA